MIKNLDHVKDDTFLVKHFPGKCYEEAFHIEVSINHMRMGTVSVTCILKIKL